MDKIWLDIIKSTGSVGLISFIIYTVINYVFSDKIVDIFGSEKMFALIITIISLLFITLLVAVLKSREKTNNSNQTKGPIVTYKNSSTHNGDNNF